MPEHASCTHAADGECVLLTPEQAAHRLVISRWKLYDLVRQDRRRCADRSFCAL
jgi:hypothetical protein